MPIAFVVARSRNNVIGCSGELPWHLKSDLRHFKDVTSGKPILMGRKTWESLKVRPLPGRDNVVLTRNPNFNAPGAFIYTSLSVALSAAKAMALGKDSAEICVVGGQEVFSELQAAVSKIYLTEVHGTYEGDTFFPELDLSDWSEASATEFPAGPGDEVSFSVRTLERNSVARAKRR
jgi:dihydrofolate reductase